MQSLLRSYGLLGGVVLLCVAAKPPQNGGGADAPAFTFTYDIGTAVTNYHAYGYASQIGYVLPQPAGTTNLVNWWVWDLGPVSGTGTVACPKPVQSSPDVKGILFFASADDLCEVWTNENTQEISGPGTNTFPIVQATVFTKKFYNGYASIQVITPKDDDADDVGIQLYWGPPFTPFGWDISPYVWNVEPADW